MLYIGILIGFVIGFALILFFEIRQIRYDDFERLLKERDNCKKKHRRK